MKTIKPIGLLVLLLFLQCGYSQIKYKAEKTIVNGDSAWKLVVEKGYTWYGISKSFSVPIQVIKNHNPQDSVLKTGAVLFFPLYSTQVPDSNHTLLNDTLTGDTVMQAYQNTTYTLSKGRPLQLSLIHI